MSNMIEATMIALRIGLILLIVPVTTAVTAAEPIGAEYKSESATAPAEFPTSAIGIPVSHPRAVPYRTRRATIEPAPVEIAPGAECADCRREAYWIVSSRRCEQLTTRPDLHCHLDYFYVAPGSRPALSTHVAFHHALDPNRPICIVVHGSFFHFSDVIRDARIAVRWLGPQVDRSVQFVFFTWPSDNMLSFIPGTDILALGTRASYNGIFLSQFITSLPENQPISFLAHSHGSRVVCGALHLLAGGELLGFRYRPALPIQRRYRVVLLAAAIDHDWLVPGNRYGRLLCATEYVLNVHNRNDLALRIYPLRRPLSGDALGHNGLQRDDYRRLGPFVNNIGQIDATPLVDIGHGWSFYFERREIAHAVAPVLTFE